MRAVGLKVILAIVANNSNLHVLSLTTKIILPNVVRRNCIP